MKKLTHVGVAAKMRRPGRHAVGNGVYLQITGENGRSWVFRYERNGHGKYVGLGSCELVSLSEAREKGLELRKLLLNGIDPIEHREAARQQAAVEAAKSATFRQCAERYIAAHEAGWSNAKHRAEWPNSLAAYVYPTIGNLPVAAIDTALVVKVLEPIWIAKTVTADRVRNRVELVLDWAKARGYRDRDSENPARWRGHLDKLLPAPEKVRKGKKKHHAALPYDELPVLMAKLRERDGVPFRALELLVLTAMRTNAVRPARWDEIDLTNRTWTVPVERMMKSEEELRVPLSKPALVVLEKMAAIRRNDFVFPGRSGPISEASLDRALKKFVDATRGTVHGMRSTFRDWAAERTNFPREIAKKAQGHLIGDETERAYQRGDLFDKRRRLMEAWAAFCGKPAAGGATVTAIGRRA